MQKNRLEGKVIVVAGGTSGIGLKVSQLLYESGVQIIVSGRKKISSSNHSELTSPGITFIQKDLRKLNEWEKLFKTVLDRFKRIDVLINCVGMLKPGRFEDLNENDIENYVKTNLLSIVYGAKAILPFFKNQNRGHIINIGSLGGLIPMPFETIYSATKFGVRGFSLSLSNELKNSGIKISHLSPGPVSTRMLDIESMDKNSSIAFVNKIYSTEKIAKEIIKLIKNPKVEVILPRFTGTIASLLSRFQNFFTLLYPILTFIGKRKQIKYRNKLLSEVSNG